MTDRAGVAVASAWAGRKVLVLSPTPTWPLDVGNRRRIYYVCRRIQQLGGEIHFLHYASEEEWGVSVPHADQRRMIGDWNAYYVAPATRALYRPPAGNAQDHALDEWWDPGIAEMLNWLFRVQNFDVFIVNYAWLSKAFEYAPANALKVLDTHDRFSGRRAMLEENGLDPDFFHIGENDERTALERADIVWAIKPQEEAIFRRMCDKRVLTLLHAEPVIKGWPRKRGEILRFGIAGSINDINIVNFRRFLEVATDYIRRTLLPCEIVLAGSCCERLGDLTYPFLRRMGRLEKMDDFYDAVDVVLGPMEFSTGLKIRIGEALGRAKAIVAHSHCFEGYIPSHPFHTLPSFEAMMLACRDIVQAPQLIDDLEAASIESMARALRSVDRALEATFATGKTIATGFVFFVALGDVWRGSLILDHVCEAAEYVGNQCEIVFFLDGDCAAADRASIMRLVRYGKLVVSPTAAVGLAQRPELVAVMRAGTAAFEDIVSGDQLGFWFAAVPEHLPRVANLIATPAFVPLSVLAHSVAEPRLFDLLRRLKEIFGEIVAMDTAQSRLLTAAIGKGVTTRLVPTLWSRDHSEAFKYIESKERLSVAVLTPWRDGPLVDLVRETAHCTTQRPVEFVYDDRREHGDLSIRRPVEAARWIAVSDYTRHLQRSETMPALVVELGACSAFGTLCELMDRSEIPRLSLFDPGAPKPAAAGRASGRVGGIMEAALTLAAWLQDETLYAAQVQRTRLRYRTLDPGWTLIWDHVKTIVAEARARRKKATKLDSERREVGAEIVLHIDHQGDCRFVGQGWAGVRGRKQGIEAFGIRPLEGLVPSDIEYRGFGPNGRQTPWVTNATLCGTRGRHLPLTGFAVRLAPHLRDRYDVVYEGAFFAGGVVGPSRNGEPCVATMADDPLEAMHVRLLERATG